MTSTSSSLEYYRLADPDGWSIWPWAVVRGTGFPSSLVLELASPDAAHAAERWSAAGLCAEPSPSPAPLDQWQAARDALAQERDKFDVLFAEGRRAARARLGELAAQPRLREAVSWQNHFACTFMLDRLARGPLDRNNAESRYAEISVASYIQRYCVKNDTIGFFGPVWWARVSPSGEALMHRPGAQLMATRKVFFEDWVVAALCRVLDRHTELRPWLREFRNVTGQPARRNAGKMYTARTLVFRDGRRADEITLVPAILDRLAPVLSILMHAGRWFTSEVARSYRKALTRPPRAARNPDEHGRGAALALVAGNAAARSPGRQDHAGAHARGRGRSSARFHDGHGTRTLNRQPHILQRADRILYEHRLSSRRAERAALSSIGHDRATLLRSGEQEGI